MHETLQDHIVQQNILLLCKTLKILSILHYELIKIAKRDISTTYRSIAITVPENKKNYIQREYLIARNLCIHIPPPSPVFDTQIFVFLKSFLPFLLALSLTYRNAPV